MTIPQARVLLVGVAMSLLAIFAGGIFDVVVWTLLIAAIVPCATAAAVMGRRTLLRVGVLALSIILSVVLVVVLDGGGLSDIVDAFTAGPRRLLSTDWPSPVRPDLLGTVAAMIALLTAIAAALASSSRLHLLPMLPGTIGLLLVTALSAPLIRPAWLAVFLVAGAGFALLHPGDTLGERLTLLRGERRLLPMLVLALGATAVLSIPVALDARADPRQNEPPEQTDALLDPIEATLALRAIDPPIPVHGIETDAPLVPTHWRTAALDRYNGRRWSPALTLRPIGRTLGPARGSTIDYSVSFLDDSIELLPLPGPPVRVDALVETDPDRTIVRVTDPPEAGEEVEVTAEMPPTEAELAIGRVGVRPVDDTVVGLAELARRLAGDGTDREQLDELERTMREDFLLDPDVSGGGLQQRLMNLFLRETQRGNEEQFATGFVLLARALGADARVATGFMTESDATTGAEVLASDDAAIWPEVLIDDEWVAFDPLPEEIYAPSSPEPEIPQSQTPAAPQPPVEPPPDPATDSDTQSDQDDEEEVTVQSGWAPWVVRIAAGATAVLLPIVLAVLVIVVWKARRRRRRLTASAATDRVRGAWATATDGLVDAGVVLRPSRTDREIATAGRGVARGAGSELDRLATMSSAASYGTPRDADAMAGEAVVCLTVIESALTDERTRWQRIRWRLSLRSLRRRTASPVTV